MCGSEIFAQTLLDLFKRANVKQNHYVWCITTMNCCTAGYIISASYFSSRMSRKVQFMTFGFLVAFFWIVSGIMLKLLVKPSKNQFTNETYTSSALGIS